MTANDAAVQQFLEEFVQFATLSSQTEMRFPLRQEDLFPCMQERTKAPSFDSHYIFHTAWAARVLAQTRPDHHVDISSSLYFVSIASAFVPMTFYDYRPAPLHLSNLESAFADLASLPFADESVESLSCMHVVEHIGLGRYGDPLDPDGDLKAMRALKRVLKKNGDLLFVVPIGRPRVMFNAHRIYSFDQVAGYFDGMELKDFSLVPDGSPATGGLIPAATKEMADRQNYGCGCFWFRKK